MQTAIGRSLVTAIALSFCFIATSYALPVGETGMQAGKPLVLVNVAKAKHAARKTAGLRRNERKTARAKANDKIAAKPAPVASKQTRDEQPNQAQSAALPPGVANANAQLTPGDVQSSHSPSTLAETDKTAGTVTAGNGVQIAAADQLNDIDRELVSQTSASVAPTQSAASADSQSTMIQTFIGQHESWNGASWIGKIFVGLGAMLTLASAARMLMA